ncbi:MAG: hypothetical protein V3S01_00855 [Dehalococcoidia bacterium]
MGSHVELGDVHIDLVTIIAQVNNDALEAVLAGIEKLKTERDEAVAELAEFRAELRLALSLERETVTGLREELKVAQNNARAYAGMAEMAQAEIARLAQV